MVAYLEHAQRIGDHLCRSAVRHDGRCVWVGRSTKEFGRAGDVGIPTVEVLDPTFYGGTAGVALFLGQLASITHDRSVRSTALEAIEHALTEAHRIPADFGLYAGKTGVAFAAARLASLLDVPDLASRGRSLVDALPRSVPDRAHLDVMSGVAGSVMALLAWPRESRADDDLERCSALGGLLANNAVAWADGQAHVEQAWAWEYSRAAGETSSTQPLTGMSHGAAGIGVVLLELFARTGHGRFGECGRGAFAYEDMFFDSMAGNWPDFRTSCSTGDGSVAALPIAWCHGAAGIALARRHALSTEHNQRWEADWRAALATCRHAAREALEPGDDTTLCHGLAGCLEPLLEAGLLAELSAVWEPLLDQFGKSNTWPSGLPSRGPNPSLMLGTAGIGWTLLRMHDPTTPSVLLPLLGVER